MALILCIETATRVCSVSLIRDNRLAALRESDEPNIHSARLTIFMEEILKEAGLSVRDLNAVAVSMGPGSYTGLRIGVAAAKGLCYALDIPLIAVPTLKAMAWGMLTSVRCQVPGAKSIIFCPMIDARRMEVYCGLYDQDNREIREVRAEIIDDNAFGDQLQDQIIVFAGDGAEKCKVHLGNHPNAVFADQFEASARFMNTIAMEKFHRKEFENLAYFEPFYLKDFVAGKPHVKGLR